MVLSPAGCLSASSLLILSPLPRGLDSAEPLPLPFPALFPRTLHEHNHVCARSATGRGGRPPSGDKRASVGRSPAINRLLGSITVSSCDAEEAGGQRKAAACSITVCRLQPLTPPPVLSTTAHFHLSLSTSALSQRHLSCWRSWLLDSFVIELNGWDKSSKLHLAFHSFIYLIFGGLLHFSKQNCFFLFVLFWGGVVWGFLCWSSHWPHMNTSYQTWKVMSYVICSNEAARAATPLPAPELNVKGQKSTAKCHPSSECGHFCDDEKKKQ